MKKERKKKLFSPINAELSHFHETALNNCEGSKNSSSAHCRQNKTGSVACLVSNMSNKQTEMG